MTELSETSKKALDIIKKHKKGVIISELAKTLGVAKSNFGSRHLKPLEDQGLVKRFKIGKDFYVKKVKKTKSEKRKLQEELSKLKQIPGIDDPDTKQKIREKVKEVIKAERKEEIKELTKPEKKAKIIEAKKGFTNGKYDKWKSAQQFEKIPLHWFQNRPIETKRYLRYLINILYSGSGRDKKIKSTYGNYANFRAIINTLIDFL